MKLMYNLAKGFMMKYVLIFIIFICFLDTNILSDSTSPYLKQHETNPINWMPWSQKAFDKAKDENKAVFLSIGYSTCHWCHVMAKESFENKEIAKLFNDNFICIKVDREEMPHLDSYYQNIHKKVKGRVGGWPLSAFLTHDKKPFYVATYIPKTKQSYHEGLDTLLEKIAKKYSDDFDSVLKETSNIQRMINTPLKIVKSANTKVSVKTLTESFLNTYDDIYSGFARAKKFPETSKLSLMMDLAVLDSNEELKEKSLEMLDVMALTFYYL